MRKADDWISLYTDYTENTEPPDLYKEWVAISCIAGALRRKCWLDWGLDYKLYPNLYVVLVAEAGRCRKNTAMNTGISLLREVGIKIAAKSTSREALIKDFSDSTELIQTDDGDYLTHASLTVCAEEITVFLGKDEHNMIMALTDWYDCADTWEYHTISRGEESIDGVWLNILGGATPKLIRSYLPMDAVGGGLASRIIFVYEDKIGKRVPAPFETQKQKLQREILVHDLSHIADMKGPFKLTQDALDRWTEWYLKIDEHSPDFPPMFEGYLNRRQTHLRKLAMVMSASRSGDMIITLSDFNKALDVLERTEWKMPRTFAGMGTSKNAEILVAFQSYISRRKVFPMRDMYIKFSGFIDDKEHFLRMLSLLEAQGFCETRKKGEVSYIYYNDNNPLSKQFGGKKN